MPSPAEQDLQKLRFDYSKPRQSARDATSAPERTAPPHAMQMLSADVARLSSSLYEEVAEMTGRAHAEEMDRRFEAIFGPSIHIKGID